MTLMLNFLNLLLDGFSVILVIRVILPLLSMSRNHNTFTRIIYQYTDFILVPVQKYFPPMRINDISLDFAPLVILLVINVIQAYL